MSLLVKRYAELSYQLLKSLSKALARINTVIILSILFILVITPAGLFKRLYIKLKGFRQQDTYWLKKTMTSNMERQF